MATPCCDTVAQLGNGSKPNLFFPLQKTLGLTGTAVGYDASSDPTLL